MDLEMIQITVTVDFFSIGGLKQNTRSLLTLVSDTVFFALSHGSLHFVLHSSFNNRLYQTSLLVGE